MLRALLAVALALLAWAGKAQAQDFSRCNEYSSNTTSGAWCRDQGEAVVAARAEAEIMRAERVRQGTPDAKVCPAEINPASIRVLVTWGTVTCGPTAGGLVASVRVFPEAKSCAARPTIYAGYYQGNLNSCVNGCLYAEGPKSEDWRIVDSRASANAINFKRGSYKSTGAVCPETQAPPPPPPPKDDYCADLDGGYKMCRNTKNQQCVVSGKTGRKYCAASDQAMNATSPDRTENVSKSAPSPTPGTPPANPTPRPGENWQNDRSITTSNTTNNTSSITNINNQTGSPNTNPGDGVPGDGGDTPGEGPGDEEGEGEEGSASGGAGCDAPPTCSGDPIACAVLDQSWRNRCGNSKGDANGDGRPDWTELRDGEGSEGVEPGNGSDEKAKAWDLSGILGDVDDSGFIGDSCPALPTLELPLIGSYDPNFAQWCDILAAIGNFFVFIASCIALRILVR